MTNIEQIMSASIRLWLPACKSVRFSLTPALSRWERENRSQRLGKPIVASGSSDSRKSEASQLLFPLPAGEDQGEGERPAIIVRPQYFKL